MAKTKILNKRRNSIRSIRKITRTMELISTASYRRAMERAVSSGAYTKRLTKMVRHLAATGAEISHPLLIPHPTEEKVALLVLTSNRGLCGGYNSSLVRAAQARWHELSDKDSSIKVPQVELQVSGKRGISFFTFRKILMAATYTQFEDKPTWAEVEEIAEQFLERYLTGDLDRLEIVYMKFESLSKQTVAHEILLPLSEIGSGDSDEPEKHSTETMYDFIPSAESILSEVVPASFKMKLFNCFLDSAVSEQIARMVAMKAATENADSMIKTLTMAVNRARQGQITGELTELIGGVEALK
ncbi:MAG: ATP synthase F1 subunit gamma [Planctomycetia bacterium]|nr:ATP synthase F1 subunit gamma [Planctomycetia bacterium]